MKGTGHFVVDGADRIDVVTEDTHGNMVHFVGHSLWEYLPGAKPVFAPYFDEARQTGSTVDASMFYAGGIVDLRIVPSGTSLAVRATRRTELNVRTLATLAQSLRTIEAELAARVPARRDSPAPASPQALP